MGRFSGLVSSAVFVGLFAILIYFCCRVKRRGAVIQQGVDANNFDNRGTAGGTTIGHQQPPISGGGEYPYPVNYGPMSAAQGVYGPTTIPTAHNSQPYTPYSYPINNSHLPYPVNGAGSMPMPMPPHAVGHNAFQQSGAPYPMAPSAPISDDYDKPPAYEDVIRQH